MSKIVSAQGSNDYKLFIDFDNGSSVIFNMQKMVNTIPYFKISDLGKFKAVKFDEKYVYWNVEDEKPEYFPLRLSVDTILFSLRG